MAIEILTADEVGEILRISGNRVVALARRGEIPFLMIDGHMRFDGHDLEEWLRYQRSDTPILPRKVIDVSNRNADQIVPKGDRHTTFRPSPSVAESNLPSGEKSEGSA